MMCVRMRGGRTYSDLAPEYFFSKFDVSDVILAKDSI